MQTMAITFWVLSQPPFFMPSDPSPHNKVAFAKCKFGPVMAAPALSVDADRQKDRTLSWCLPLSSAHADAGLPRAHPIHPHLLLSRCHKSPYCSQGKAIPLMRTDLSHHSMPFFCSPLALHYQADFSDFISIGLLSPPAPQWLELSLLLLTTVFSGPIIGPAILRKWECEVCLLLSIRLLILFMVFLMNGVYKVIHKYVIKRTNLCSC